MKASSRERYSRAARTLLAAAACGVMAGCATNQAALEANDPLEPMNRGLYQVNEGLDKVIKPVAEVYADVTPEPVRNSVTNFYDNLGYLNTVLNNFLQGKGKDGFTALGRFLVNSTFGIGGLFDPATKLGMERRTEDLGQTLAHYGADEGAYLVLPLFGPSSVRDAPDAATSLFLTPLFYLGGTVLFPVTALNAVNTRANLLEATRVRDQAALDPYVFTREAWRQRRLYEIYDGDPPPVSLDEFMGEDFFEEEEEAAYNADVEEAGADADAVLRVE